MGKKRTTAELREIAHHRHDTLTCTVLGCYSPPDRHQLSRLCMKHRRRLYTMGHPTGRSVTRTMFDRWRVKIVRSFLEEHKDHEGIRNACDFIDQLLETAQRPTSYGRHLTDLQKMGYWLSLLRIRGVDGQEVFEALVAFYAMRESDPDHFKTDRHWRHQFVMRTLSLGCRHGDGLPGHVKPSETNVNLREMLYQRIHQRVGLLAMRAGKEVVERLPAFYERQRPVQGSDAPFARAASLAEQSLNA